MNTGKAMSRFFCFTVAAVIVLVSTMPQTSYATDVTWFGGTGNWNDPLNWSPTGVPATFSDNVTVTNTTGHSETSSITSDVGTIGSLQVYGSGTKTMTLSISDGGRLRVVGEPVINNQGILDQTGGTFLTPNRTVIAVGGTYNLQGGLYENFLNPLIVSGVFNQTGGHVMADDIEVQNGGVYNFSGGEVTSSRTGVAALWNSGSTNLSGSGTRVINGVFNDGIFKTTNTSAIFNTEFGVPPLFPYDRNGFYNDGAYISDHATQTFSYLTITQFGYLFGGHADKFYVTGDFVNSSRMSSLWNTQNAYLGFIDGADNQHDFYLTGFDYGSTLAGYRNNFAWGTLDLRNQSLSLFDGSPELGAGLYLGGLWGAQIGGDYVANLFGFDGLTIYYDQYADGNSYLGGHDYYLTGGGRLTPVPEPASMFLLGSGLAGLALIRKRFGVYGS